jgi:NAD(P)-dependent dehydrogenase (short-subunit alcohol dehydrogenase family)
VAVHGTRPSEPLDATLAEVRSLSADSAAVTGDLSAHGAAAALMAATVAAIGEPDIVVANASVQFRRPWMEIGRMRRIFKCS